MAIVFEEVTGEIAPERGAAQADAPETQTPDGEDLADTLRRELCLLRERERRLRAD